MAHLKGQHVNLVYKDGDSWRMIASSTNCSLDVTANTADGASKSDVSEGVFDNPEFLNYSWSASNESFISDIAGLEFLLKKCLNGDGEIDIQFGNGLSYGNRFAKQGHAIISSLTIDAANGEFAKLSVSFDGSGYLTDVSPIHPTIVPSATKIKGKALMVAMKTGTAGGSLVWQTIACSTSHKLTVNLNLSDITDKDYNDATVLKEVTGKSVSLSTENLIESIEGAHGATGAEVEDIFNLLSTGAAVRVAFGYYPNSIGEEIHGGGDANMNGWGDPIDILIEGDFMVSSFSMSGANKENATFSAEFQNKGYVLVKDKDTNL